MTIFRDQNIVLAVTGGIAAFKAAELARLLIHEEAVVRVAMTEAATRFVTPLTFQHLTGEPVATDLWSTERPHEIGHITLADWAKVIVVAPATANFIGKMAAGIADDFLTTFTLAARCPILVCPAMNVNMYDNPIVQENIKKLCSLGVKVLDPASGLLACGWEGKGRLPQPEEIVEALRTILSPDDMAGLRVMVTAGPTWEAWDAIRYLGNRSTGQMGRALATAARRRGAEVTLVTGPTGAPAPIGVETVEIESTRDLLEAVDARFDQVDVLVKAAAPADFRPAFKVEGKVKKTEVPPPIELTRNPDVLAAMGQKKGKQTLVGFAAESENLIENAKLKLKKKNADLMVANQIGPPDESFGASTNRVWIIDRQDNIEELPLLAKEEVASLIWDRVLALRE